MPWLEKDEVLFIHVPRCGGTSITKHHRVGPKAWKGKNLYYNLGLRYYYYRYRILESANFPVMTIENLIAVCQFTLAWALFYFFRGLPFPYVMMGTSSFLFFSSTFLYTAPVLMRVNWMRIALMYFQDQILCKVGSETNYLVGTNRNGYLFHLTAERCIRYGYVTEEDMKRKSFSIVRNPYSRAVSMYEYNKRLCESFEHFIKDFHKRCMKVYHQQGKTDSNYIYCHILPMEAYTHINGKQVVNTIIKQEHLKRLLATNWEDSGVPDKIKAALTGIPHANARKKTKPWQEYYTQETMDLVMEMYEKDFDVFGYDKFIPGRPDLVPTIKLRAQSLSQINSIQTEAGTMLRQSISLQQDEIKDFNFNVTHEVHHHNQPNLVQNQDPTQQMARKKAVSMSIERKSKSAKDLEFALTDKNLNNQSSTTAGEETSESGAAGNDLNENDFKGVHKQRMFSVDGKEHWDRDLMMRKKRSASAFVLHVP